jgi:adenine-specific DNA-methyltransferase
MELVQELNPSYPSVAEIEAVVKELFRDHQAAYKNELEAQGRHWNAAAKRQDPWRGIYPYSRAEYRDSDGRYVPEDEAEARRAAIWIWREISPAAPASKQAASTKDPDDPNFRYYRPLHPLTRKPTPHPRGGWKFPLEPDPNDPDRRSFVELDRDYRISWGKNEKKVPQSKGFLRDVETNIGTSVFYEYNDGEAEVAAMFGRSGLFLSPKSSKFVRRFVSQTTKATGIVLDCFAGTGSTAHAVVSVNHTDRGNRKYILVEVGEYFDTLVKPRVLKAAYSPDWRDGKPVLREGSSHALKYLRLESYEDALMNVDLHAPDSSQRDLLSSLPKMREGYFLHYALRAEAEGSRSLLAVDRFAEPFEYRLTLFRPGATKAVVVDLPETFNWLLGLAVERVQRIDGLQTIEGVDPDGHRVLVIWRSLSDERHSNERLEVFLTAQGYLNRSGDDALDHIYVNGDCTLSRLRRDGANWQVSLTEEAFQRLMFDAADMGRV